MCIIVFLYYYLAHIFAPRYGPFSVCMLCLRVSWALDLWVHSSHYFLLPLHYRISSLLIGCVLHLLFFILSVACSASSSSTLSDDPPQLITWRIVMSFSLSIPQILIQRSSVWDGHLVRESLCYISIWDYVCPFVTSFLELLCLRS